MLPDDLRGPETSIHNADESELADFLASASEKYPGLPGDFLTQICFELPSDFDGWLPGFDVTVNRVVVRRVATHWIKANVRYDDDERLDSSRFYGSEVEDKSLQNDPAYSLRRDMLSANTWPFRPVIVKHEHAVQNLGGWSGLGRPYHLIEGCHRISYLLKMVELGLVSPNSEHEVLEVV